MNKTVLKEFLKCGVCFNGELFPTEVGISLGSNLSPLLGNMILDGIQKELYDLQGKEIQDFKNGYMVRFADDIAITARTKEDAEKFKRIVEDFISKRGLRLSKTKSKIVNIHEGFDFLARHYIKINNHLDVIPSERAVKNFEKELEDLILNPEQHWTQKTLIQSVNSKLYGWATYHRIEESEEIFKHIDVLVNALLLRLMQKKYPNKSITQLKNKFWYMLPDGRYVFALANNKKFSVVNLADIVLVKHKRMILKENIFLDTEYFKEWNEEQDINKVSAKYQSVWERQGGKCYFCGKPITKEQEKSIIYKTISETNRIQDMAYVHSFCKNDELLYIDTDIMHLTASNLRQIFEDIDDDKKPLGTSTGKFKELENFFHSQNKTPITLTFKDLEKLVGYKLCHSAFKYPAYWYQKRTGSISCAWLDQNYEILKLDMKNQKVTFTRIQSKSSKLNIPEVFLTNKIPDGAKYELEEFFGYITKKYGLSSKKI